MEFKKLIVDCGTYKNKILPYFEANYFNKEHPTSMLGCSTLHLLNEGLAQTDFDIDSNKIIISVNEPNSKKPFFKDLEKLSKGEELN